MTITMAKLPGRPGVLLPLAAAAMLMASECRADWRVYPTIGLTETYTDNINLRPKRQEESSFVTEINPGLALVGSGRRFKVSATGQFRHYEYAGSKPSNTSNNVREFGLSGQGVLAEDLLFIDLSAGSSPQSVSAFGPQLNNNLYALGNRTQLKTWRISPYLDKRFGNDARFTARYSRDSVESDRFNAFGDSLGSSISLALTSGPSYHTLGWGLNYMQQDLVNELTGASSTETVSGNVSYALTRRFALTARAGYDRYDFEGPGEETAGRNWSLGFNWTPSLRTSLSASIGRHFYGQTGMLNASHRSRHTTWSVKYDDGITNTRSQFLLPAAIDTAALLDGLFAPTISDPLLRQQAVANYIRINGLPPSLAESINYLSNRYVRQKQLQGSMAFSKAHSSAVVTVYRSERNALSEQQSDSPLLGSELSSLNDNVRQHGANMVYTYRFSSRTSATASALFSRSKSLETGFEDNRRQLRLGMSRQLGNKLRAAVELRQHRGSAGINTGTFRENAISAGLSMQL